MCWSAVLAISNGSVVAAEKRVLSLGVEPQLHAVTLDRVWASFIQAWEKRAGISVIVEIPSNMQVYRQRVSDGAYDLVYVSSDYVGASASRYLPVARARNKSQAVLVVARDGAITRVEELKDRRVAFPEDQVDSSTNFMTFFRERLIRIQPDHLANDEAVFRGVGAGLYPGGVGSLQALVASGMENKLRVLTQIKQRSTTWIGRHRELSRETVARISDSLRAMSDQSGARESLSLFSQSGFDILPAPEKTRGAP